MCESIRPRTDFASTSPRSLMSESDSSLLPKSHDTILGWWAQELGVNVPELQARANGVTLTASSNLPGIFVFRREKDLRIAALFAKLDPIHDAILGKTFGDVLNPEFWTGHPSLSAGAVGPVSLYYLDAVPAGWTTTVPRGLTVRGLAAMDAKAFAALADALTPVEREESGLELSPRPLWGVFQGKELIAAAGYDVWPGRIAHMGVAVHPAHRGKKLGQMALQAATRGALTRRRIVQYRALSTNPASVGIVKALKFVPFAETLYILPPIVTY